MQKTAENMITRHAFSGTLRTHVITLTALGVIIFKTLKINHPELDSEKYYCMINKKEVKKQHTKSAYKL